MNKTEYLWSLSHYLRELNGQERQKQLDYYDEMLSDMQEDGLSMDEICERLGTPEQLAEEILAGMGRPMPSEDDGSADESAEESTLERDESAAVPKRTRPSAPKKRRLTWLWVVLALIAAALLLRLFAAWLFDARRGEGLFEYVRREISEEIRDELDLDEPYRASTPSPMPMPTSAPQPVPTEAGVAAQGVPTEAVTVTPTPMPAAAAEIPSGAQSFDGSAYRAVELEWGSGNVYVYPSTDGSIYVTAGALTPNVRKDEETLVLTAPQGQSLFGKQPDVTLYLPQTLSELEVETGSGAVWAQGVNLQELSLSAASGSLTVVGTATELDLSTTSGSIFASLEGLCRELDIESTSGDIEISGEVTDFEAHSSSGDVNADFSNTPQELGVTTTSGNVYLALPADAQFSCSHHSSSGQMYNAFAHHDHHGGANYIVRTTSGNLNIVAN